MSNTVRELAAEGISPEILRQLEKSKTNLRDVIEQIVSQFPPEMQAEVRTKYLKDATESLSLALIEREGAIADIRAARIQQFHQWAESNDHNSPLLTDEAISRDTIYGAR